jgi:hypothetical protein
MYEITLQVKPLRENENEKKYFTFFGKKDMHLCDRHFSRLIKQIMSPDQYRCWLHDKTKPVYETLDKFSEEGENSETEKAVS